MRLITLGLYPHEARKILMSTYEVKRRTADSYAARARALLLEELGSDREEHRAGSLAFYRSICADAAAAPRDRLLARKRVDELLGLDAPKQVQVAGAGGGAIQVADGNEYTDPELRQLARKMERRRAAVVAAQAAGHDDSNSTDSDGDGGA